VVDDLSSALDSLLARDEAAVRAWESSEFDRLAHGRERSVVLMGSGGLGRRCAAALRANGIEPLAFADNSAARQGTTVDGIRVLSPEAAAGEFGKRAVFVVAIWGANSPHRLAHSRQQLTKLGCDRIVSFAPLSWKYANDLLPHYLQDLPHKVIAQKATVRAAVDLWEDDASRAEYVSQMRLRLLADFGGLSHPVEHPAYFPPDLYEWRDDEWIVDGGAYDGDTIRTLSALHGDQFGHLLALEPDPANFVKLEATVAGLSSAARARIDCRQMALASTPRTLHLAATGTASSATTAVFGAGTIAVPAQPLDALLGGAAPTMIKLDIEGAEPDALLGARDTIRRHAPVLAICVYHRQDHLWSIPLMLREWQDDYAFFLRPHNEEGWDLVCYAVPRARLSRTP
jgi:FkbM family methyltransferase